MKLSEWAQVGEVVGMVGVVMSLLIVAYSVNQNTEALQGENGNLIFEQHAELSTLFMTDSSLAEILVKMKTRDTELTDIESVRWERYRLNLLDIWAMAFNRHRQELLGDEQWQAWDTYFVHTFSDDAEKLSKADWEHYTYGYDRDFWAHVSHELFAN